MAVIGSLEIPQELIDLWNTTFRPVEKRRYSAVAAKGHLMTPQKKRDVATRSLLPEISAAWAALSDSQRLAWKNAGDQSRYNAWNLFVQDTAYRLKYGLSGLATPSIYHQYKVGKITIGGSAQRVLLTQYHPTTYYKMKKIRGSKAQYEPIKITEQLVLPLELGMSYKTALTAVTGTPKVKFYATVISHYQGRNISTNFGFDMDLSSGWARQTTSVTEVLGVARSYNLNIELDGVQGEFYFDNVLSQHTGTNYARDFRCNDVNNDLSAINYMIESSWEEQFLPTGAAFDSVYVDS